MHKYRGFEKITTEAKLEINRIRQTFIVSVFMQQFFILFFAFVFHFFASSGFFEFLFDYYFYLFLLTLPILVYTYRNISSRADEETRQIDSKEFMRGSLMIYERELSELILTDILLDNTSLSNSNNLLHIGKIPVPNWAETRHFLIVGRPGTGKTTLLNQVLETLRQRQAKAVIHDFKGDYLSYFYDPSTDIIFNPLDRRSVNWCLFSEIEMQPDIDSIATSMIPESFHQDKFWVDAARDVFSSILYYLKITKQESNQAIWEYVTKPEPEMIQLMQQAVASGLEQAKRAYGYLQGYEKGSKVASDVLSTMRQYTNCFQYMTHLQSEFSIKKWLENDHQGGFIFITNYANLRDTLKPILSLFIDIALKHLLSLNESQKRRVFFVLDEFASLMRLTSIVRTLEQGRSKGASVWIATQDISQLQKIYSHETTYTITNNCNTIVSFAINDPNSCEYMSKVFGDVEILENTQNLSMGPHDMRDGFSISKTEKIKRLLMPSEFSSLPDLHFYIKMLSYPATFSSLTFDIMQAKHNSFEANDIFKFSNEQKKIEN